jgi:hypothetical protein
MNLLLLCSIVLILSAKKMAYVIQFLKIFEVPPPVKRPPSPGS